MKLTEKQETFVQELIKGKSQREAYKIAYDAEKMSDKTIDEKASRLLNKDKVRARYNELHSRLIKEAEDECIVSAKDVLRELSKVGFADIKDYLSFGTALTTVGYNDDGEKIIDYAHVVQLKNSDEIDGSIVSEVSLKDGALKFKLHDKMKALNDLGRHLGMFVDKVETKNDTEIKVNFNIPRPK